MWYIYTSLKTIFPTKIHTSKKRNETEKYGYSIWNFVEQMRSERGSSNSTGSRDGHTDLQLWWPMTSSMFEHDCFKNKAMNYRYFHIGS